jgi:hypothetical protein
MTLTLTHTQRLNLHALIGAQRATVDDMRLWWRIQDRIELDGEEREAIGYQIGQINGMQQVGWDATKTLPLKEYEFSGDEMQKLTAMINQWQAGYMVASDRLWLEPLLTALERNGSEPK